MRKNNNLATENNIGQLPTKKQKIFIAGYSMITYITGTGISTNHIVKIRFHPGATDIDMLYRYQIQV